KAQYDLEVNREKVKVSLARANATMVQIRNRKLRSPIDGFIDEIYQNEGQWVREGDQILHILRLDKVQVTGTIDASQYAPEDVDGKTILVTVRRPGAEPVDLTGKIVYVRQVIESGCYYFYADVENKTVRNKETGKDYWLLNPGSLVTVTIKAK
ncbi:MAG: HlyD family efflux transporter periplasmic adaptor subunit, partial [Thermoguttaceae bacterium]|nr:HlyD family efflux transporter periplasmic adaptor subunit [Thermoguttaceae bacterium]